ncbi:MAG: uroporphyrinogen-III C-methyltransferase [Tissierellia bacterium]|nr:uroporphyrinogen-III C-methyltransferase [Tissierellia bacterium]
MSSGKVLIIGAGIGSSDNITIKAKKALDSADIIIYDRLINSDIIREYEGSKELIYVGKKAYSEYMQQDEINDLIIEKARSGKIIARLKGGDPYVFGRGGEEAETLVENGIDFEVIPGVTSGVVALMTAGIPATHRGKSTSVSFITGHRKEGMDFDFSPYAKIDGTLVFYMGLKNLGSISKGLINGGMDSNTPISVIMNGGYPTQKTIVSTLENIEKDIEGKGFKSPSLIVVGEVVSLREKLDFFESRLLFGRTIVVTRAKNQASQLVEKLDALGANVIQAPTIEISKINSDLLNSTIKSFDYTHLVFNSVNGVEIFMDEFLAQHDIRALANTKLCVVGLKTKEALKKYGLNADIMPENYVGEELSDAIISNSDENSKVLLVHSLKSRKSIIDKLKKCVNTDAIPIYDSVKPEDTIELPSDIDYILFTSSSTVNNFINAYGNECINNSKIVSIGPITTKTIESNNLSLYGETKNATIDAMIDFLKEDVRNEFKNEKA